MLLAWFDIAEGLVHHDHEVIRHEHVLGDAGVGACALHAGDIPAILDFELAEGDVDHVDAWNDRAFIAFQDDAGLGPVGLARAGGVGPRSEEHTSELQALMRISYAVFCLNKKSITADSTRI